MGIHTVVCPMHRVSSGDDIGILPSSVLHGSWLFLQKTLSRFSNAALEATGGCEVRDSSDRSLTHGRVAIC